MKFFLLTLVPLVHGTEITHNAGIDFNGDLFVRHGFLQG